jgi:hypothetical protein
MDAKINEQILGAKLNDFRSSDFLVTATIGIGCAVLGLAPSFYELKPLLGYACLGVGLALIIVSIVYKFYKK